MLTILYLIGTFIVDLIFKSRRRLGAENLFLRHQLNIALRRAPHRLRLRRPSPAGVDDPPHAEPARSELYRSAGDRVAWTSSSISDLLSREGAPTSSPTNK